MHDCEKLREDIWEAVEAGQTIDGLLSVIGDCEACRCELARAESAMLGFQAIRAADCPDCSGVVMAGIDSTAHKGRAVWAYAFGLALVLAIVGVVAGLHRSRPTVRTMDVVKGSVHSPITQHGPQPPVTASDWKKPEHRDRSPEADRTVINTRVESAHRTARTSPKPLHSPRIRGEMDRPRAVASDGNQPDHHDSNVVATTPPEQNKPQLMIIVTDGFSGQDDDSDAALEYAYTQTNPDTGDVTQCSVKRSGESVEIRMDVKPGDKKAPGEGRLDYESAINA